jgi:hypothetical protein
VTRKKQLDLQIADDVAKFYDDPLGFVRYAFPWRQPGTILEHFDGPDTWHEEYLNELGRQVRERGFDGRNAVPAIRMAVSSGHSVGKSSCVAWLVCWIMSTRPHCQGTLTATTAHQLETKTWSAVEKWLKLCITSGWFTITSERLFHKDHKESWFCAPQTCSLSDAFAGQHAATSTSFYIFDEASGVPDGVWDVAEGGCLSGESHFYCFGNPTKNSGKFYRSVFGSERNRWTTKVIDSRDCQIANQQQIAEWVKEYGEDSDFVRVRVKGVPPRGSDLQFIDNERVKNARERQPFFEDSDPLVVGVDIARGGSDSNVICFRRGTDAKSIPAIKIPGAETRDSMRMVSKLAEVLSGACSNGMKPDVMFIDGTGIGGPIVDRLKQLGYRNVIEIQFGWKSPDNKYANQRAYMWGKMRDWLNSGCIANDPELEVDLTAPGYSHNSSDAILLESKETIKKRGLNSPDGGDALALTFAQPVAPKIIRPMLGDRPLNAQSGPYYGSGSPRRGTPWI